MDYKIEYEKIKKLIPRFPELKENLIEIEKLMNKNKYNWISNKYDLKFYIDYENEFLKFENGIVYTFAEILSLKNKSKEQNLIWELKSKFKNMMFLTERKINA